MKDERTIQRDRMRFIKNTQSANLALVGIFFNVLYFVSIYQSDVGSYYYNILVGGSIVYNLVFMLAVFLSSEGVKNYMKNYSYILAGIGALQIGRIFIIPMKAHSAVIAVNGVETPVMQNGQFTYVLVCLIASAVCLVLAAIINFKKCGELEAHLKTIEAQ